MASQARRFAETATRETGGYKSGGGSGRVVSPSKAGDLSPDRSTAGPVTTRMATRRPRTVPYQPSFGPLGREFLAIGTLNRLYRDHTRRIATPR